MKKHALTVLLFLAVCGMAFGNEQITAEEAFRIALRTTNDPVVGIWRMHPNSGGRVAHIAIVPNATSKRKNWRYLGIMLEDGFQIKKNGVKIALNHTLFGEATYDVILSNRVSKTGNVYPDGAGFAFLNGNVLDMSRVVVPPEYLISFDDLIDRQAPIAHMIKVRDFPMETAGQKFSLSGLSFDGIKIKTAEPGSLAENAGLKPGDTILEVNGRPADENLPEDIDARLAAGRAVMIEYERDGVRDLVTLKYALN